MLLSKSVCGTENSRFTKEQEACGLLSRLGIKTPLCKIPLIGNTFFKWFLNVITIL